MKILLLITVLAPFIGVAQSIPDSVSAPLTYTDVVAVDSVSKEELYNRARAWFNYAFRDSKSVLNIEDASSGELSGKGALEYSSKVFVGNLVTSGWVHYQVSVFVKEGRYKYEITNFIHEGSRSNQYPASNFGLITTDSICPYHQKWNAQKWGNKVWDDIKSQIEPNISALIKSLKESMRKPSPVAEKW